MKESGKIKFIDGIVINTQKNKKQKVVIDDIESIIKITKEIKEFFELYKLLNGDLVYICCEFPHGGAKGARANRTMGMATAQIATMFTLINNFFIIPITPDEVKFALFPRMKIKWKETKSKKPKISKKQIIKAVRKLLGEDKCKIIDSKIKKADWEHFADSVGAIIYSTKRKKYLC